MATPSCSTFSTTAWRASKALLRRPRRGRGGGGRCRDSARKALKLIEVDYEVLPHVTDVDEAMKPSRSAAARDMLHRAASTPSPTAPSNIAKPQPVRPRRCRSGLQGGRRHRRAHLQDRADAPGLHRAACLRGEREFRRHRRTVGLHPGPFRLTASTAPNCSAWRSRSCASPPRRSAAASAARPMSGPSRSRWRCRARRAAGQAGDDARGGVPRLRAHQRHLDRRQDRREEGRHHHRRIGDAALHLRPLSRTRGPSSAP